MQPWHAAVGQVKVANGLSALVGCWEIASPFVLGYDMLLAPTVNALIAGAIVALVSIHMLGPFHVCRMFWVVPTVGLWLIVAPVILDYAAVPRTNDVVVGIVVVILGLWSAVASNVAS